MSLTQIKFSLTADTKMDIKTIAGQGICLFVIHPAVIWLFLPPDFLLSD